MWRQVSLEDEMITENSEGAPSGRRRRQRDEDRGASHVLFLKLGGVNIHCLS